MEKMSFDDFLACLKTEMENIEVEIIRCIAIHKSGIHHLDAHVFIESFLGRQDRDVIQGKLTTLSNKSDYIYLDGETYKFNYNTNANIIISIPYIPEKPIRNCGVAMGDEARTSKKEIMRNTKSCVYLFMSDTSVLSFKEFINYRIEKRYKTVVLFPHKKCFDINLKTIYEENLDSWIRYLNIAGVSNYLDFYLIKDKKYKYLYSSCLTKNIFRYDYYTYSDTNEIHTAYGMIYTGESGTSFYDMIKKEYECAFYERIPVSVANWNFTKKITEHISSFFRRHWVKITIFIFALSAVVSCIKIDQASVAPTVSSIFVLLTMVIGFLQHSINNLLTKGKLKFGEDE